MQKIQAEQSIYLNQNQKTCIFWSELDLNFGFKTRRYPDRIETPADLRALRYRQ